MRKSTFISIALTAVSFLMAGCYHDYYELRESEFGNLPVGYVAPLIDWEQEDAAVPVHDLTIVAVGNGISDSKSYDHIPDIAKDPLQIPKGEYKVLYKVNMTEPDGYDRTDDVTVSLIDSAKLPAQAWFGVTNTIIRADTIVIAETKLQPLLSVLKLNMTNVPTGTVVTIKLGNVAKNIKLTAKDENGRYGVPDSISMGYMVIDTLTAGDDGVISSDELLLPPTVSDIDSTDMIIGIMLADGGTFDCICNAPRIATGCTYALNLDFDALTTSMKFNSNSISQRREEWTAIPDSFKVSAYPTWQLAVPLTIEAVTPGAQVRFTLSDAVAANSVQFRTGSGASWSDWADYTGGSDIVLEHAGDMVQFRGDNAKYTTQDYKYSKISFTEDCYVYGNIMSLITSTDYIDCNVLTATFSLSRLFCENSHLLSHPSRDILLPAVTLTDYCYYGLFEDCSALSRVPRLPAVNLAKDCCSFMFGNCASIETLPEQMLPATKLAELCYFAMFSKCSGLTALPEDLLPATTLVDACYNNMFERCTGLKSIPENLLPATTLDEACYGFMFYLCTGLTTIPQDLLPAVNLKKYCYEGMFSCCTGLKSIPEKLLPATTLTESCYSAMFSCCTGLTIVPENLLHSTTLAEGCYRSMFSSCTNLIGAPKLPATTLSRYCYHWMFENCTSLTESPVLDARGLAYGCYEELFSGCSSLNSVTCFVHYFFTDNMVERHYEYMNKWLDGVATNGTLTVDVLKDWTDNDGCVSAGWAIAEK